MKTLQNGEKMEQTKPIKQDRRVKRTRALLLQSLTDLLEEKDLKDITVKEICELADLNRGTFYLHYRDVFDMMEQIQNELFRNFKEILETCSNSTKIDDGPHDVLIGFFQILNENRQISKVLLGPHGDHQFVLRTKKLVKEHISEVWIKNNYNIKNFEIFYSYCISGIIGVIEYWLEMENPKTPKEMAELVTDFIIQELSLLSDAKNF